MESKTDECLSVFNVDGSMRKSCKSNLLQEFKLDPVAETPVDHISIVDMGMIWRMATPSKEDRETKRRDGRSYLWNDYLDKICSMVMARHSTAKLIILVNDKYDLEYSIKADEHQRRAAKYQKIPNVFPKPEDEFPGGTDFNKLMVKCANKVRLQKLVMEQMSAHVGEVNGTIIYCTGETAINLTTGEPERHFRFNHTEADSILLSVYAELQEIGHAEVVVLDSEDTDVYVQASYVSNEVAGDLMIRRKDHLVRCSTMLPADVANYHFMSSVVVTIPLVSLATERRSYCASVRKTLKQWTYFLMLEKEGS